MLFWSSAKASVETPSAITRMRNREPSFFMLSPFCLANSKFLDHIRRNDEYRMNVSEAQRLRVVLRDLYRAALAGVDPKRSTANALMPPAVAGFLASGRRLGTFAVGKAAAGMLEGAPRGDRALAILPKGYPPPRRGSVEALFSAHPFPD